MKRVAGILVLAGTAVVAHASIVVQEVAVQAIALASDSGGTDGQEQSASGIAYAGANAEFLKSGAASPYGAHTIGNVWADLSQQDRRLDVTLMNLGMARSQKGPHLGIPQTDRASGESTLNQIVRFRVNEISILQFSLQHYGFAHNDAHNWEYRRSVFLDSLVAPLWQSSGDYPHPNDFDYSFYMGAFVLQPGDHFVALKLENRALGGPTELLPEVGSFISTHETRNWYDPQTTLLESRFWVTQSPVPEPLTALGLASGLILLRGRRRAPYRQP